MNIRIAGVLALLAALLFYVGLRIWMVLPCQKVWKVAVLLLYLLAAVSFFMSVSGRLDRLPMGLASAVYVYGNSWFIAMAYILMALAVLDLLWAFGLDFHRSSVWGTALLLGSVAIVLTLGGFHYHHKYREEIRIVSPKVDRPLRIVMASDLHLGYHNRCEEFRRWVDILNAEHPDLILVAGDIVDRSVRPLIEENDAAVFRTLEAPVYACLGNHEYISGIAPALEFYSEAGIHLLRDSVATVQGITVIGRDDRMAAGRAALPDLVKDIDNESFTILLDHQPSDLAAAQSSGIDFQLSGHTHNGQIWPGNLIVKRVFENPYGHLVKGGTRYYVTSGLGIWGGKFRIGTRSEYVVLDLVPEN